MANSKNWSIERTKRLSQEEIATWKVWDEHFEPLFDPWLALAMVCALLHNANSKKPVAPERYYLPSLIRPKPKTARTRLAAMRAAGHKPKVVRFKKEESNPK